MLATGSPAWRSARTGVYPGRYRGQYGPCTHPSQVPRTPPPWTPDPGPSRASGPGPIPRVERAPSRGDREANRVSPGDTLFGRPPPVGKNVARNRNNHGFDRTRDYWLSQRPVASRYALSAESA